MNMYQIPDAVIRTIIVLVVFYAITSFLLTLVRMLLNHRLKNNLIKNHIVGPEANKLLAPNADKDYAVKWFLLLFAAGFGFALMSCFPFGWISVAILSLSLSMGFAAYYYYLITRPK